MERIDNARSYKDFIIHNLEGHERNISRLVAENFNVSRITALKYIQELIDDGILIAKGKTKDRQYALKELVEKNVTLEVTPQLQEDVVWREEIKPELSDLRENVLGICAHGFSEMLNNVISHSESPVARIYLLRNAARIVLYVMDDGIGIFRKIQSQFKLADPQHALLELAKGKLTTDEAKHAGEGIFFTSRMFNKFMISSDLIDFCRLTNESDWFFEDRTEPVKGTTVLMEIRANATQTAKAIFDMYRAEFDTFGFSKTIIPLVLMQYEGEKLISRSQAKRLLSRADLFKEVYLDFKGITEIGQAFADEVFRVYVNSHPGVSIRHVNATQDVENMIKRVQSVRPALAD
jgi:anti-sigma regulatory factor (Ser/Thr protein kinase)/predicted transcriptional regulator